MCKYLGRLLTIADVIINVAEREDNWDTKVSVVEDSMHIYLLNWTVGTICGISYRPWRSLILCSSNGFV